MTSHPKIFELLKEYMDTDSQSERWITVQEFRTYFHLKKSFSPVISGYFQRIFQNPTYLCPYRVIKTEQIRDPSNPYRSVRRYLVKKAPWSGKKCPERYPESLSLKPLCNRKIMGNLIVIGKEQEIAADNTNEATE